MLVEFNIFLTLHVCHILQISTAKRQTPQCLRIPSTTDDQIHGMKNERPADYNLTNDEDYEILSSELKNRDNLLSMLTEGLREVK
jgi:hypothetical protein